MRLKNAQVKKYVPWAENTYTDKTVGEEISSVPTSADNLMFFVHTHKKEKQSPINLSHKTATALTSNETGPRVHPGACLETVMP